MRPSPDLTRSDPSAERGQALVLIVVTLVVLLGAAALTIDVGYAYVAHRSLQADADAAALAGAGGLPNTATATSLAKQYSGSTGGKNIKANIPGVDGRAQVPGVGGCTTTNAVHVTQHATVKSFFARVIGVKQFEVNADATACSPGLGTATLVDEGTSSCPLPPGRACSATRSTAAIRARAWCSTRARCYARLRRASPGRAGRHDQGLVQRRARADARHPADPGEGVEVGHQRARQLPDHGPRRRPLGDDDPRRRLDPDVGRPGRQRPGEPARVSGRIRHRHHERPHHPQRRLAVRRHPDPTERGLRHVEECRQADRPDEGDKVAVTPDTDPAKNNWTLGTGSDTPPSGLTNEGFGAEARWNVNDLGLQPGHAYCLQFMVHDGDQHSTGGDVGQACMHVLIPG